MSIKLLLTNPTHHPLPTKQLGQQQSQTYQFYKEFSNANDENAQEETKTTAQV
jgi:hypothetical protein